MSDLVKSLGTLVSDMGHAARKEITDSLRPALKKLSEALNEIESRLQAAERASSGKKKRGRPVGSGRKAGEKAGTKKGAKRGSKRAPRGALESAVREVLGRSGKPMKLSQIRDGVIKNPVFRGRDPKTLYTMIVFATKKMPEVKKTAGGLYAIDAKGAGSKSKKK